MKRERPSVSVQDAQSIILDSITPLGPEMISTFDAYNRVLFRDIIADIMIPPVDDSAMDGYAVIADDTIGASKNIPVRLRVTGEVQAGASAAGKQVIKGTAIRIMTGAPVPQGADSVIRVEDTEEEAGYVKIFCETVKYKNYRQAGENIKKGDKVLSRGCRLTSANLGFLASLNRIEVEVYKQPTVSIISTGDELADIGEEMQTGQIRNVNAHTLYAELKRYSALPEYSGIARDTFEETRDKFLKALKSDVVISTGGVSMGKYDFVKEIFSSLDIEIKFERVNVKPGGPCIFGEKDNKLVFGLPGNPVSTLTSFIQFVRPALLRLMGADKLHKPMINAFLEEEIQKKNGKVNLLRGYFTIKDNEIYVSTTGSQKTSVLGSMSGANCLIIVPEDITEVKSGEKVLIQLIDHSETW